MKSCEIQHVAIIMDGNGRWANERLLPRFHGHSAGANAVHKAITAAVNKGIKYLTVFALSSENTLRPPKEVAFLKNIFYRHLTDKLQDFISNNIRIKFIGDLSFFDQKLLDKMHSAEYETQSNTGLVFTVALNYGGRWDIVNACNKIINDCLEKDQKNLSEKVCVSEQLFEKYLSTHDLPDPDLIIRTSGEKRISNFLLWQLAYAELFFTDKYWPDFNESDFDEAVKFYYNSNRRFGLVEDKVI